MPVLPLPAACFTTGLRVESTAERKSNFLSGSYQAEIKFPIRNGPTFVK